MKHISTMKLSNSLNCHIFKILYAFCLDILLLGKKSCRPFKFLFTPAFNLFKLNPAYSTLFHHYSAYSNLFQPIPAISSLLQPPPVEPSHWDGPSSYYKNLLLLQMSFSVCSFLLRLKSILISGSKKLVQETLPRHIKHLIVNSEKKLNWL